MSDRLSLALPVDVVRQYDTTVTSAEISADQFQSSGDDVDLMVSMIEDAEDEFRRLTDADMRVGRVGVPDQRPTFEQQTYKLSGHKSYRQAFSDYSFNYDYDEVELHLANDRVLPFDPDEGDAVYVYHGLGDGVGGNWEDITDEQGGMWAVVDHPGGVLAVDPNLLHEAMHNQYGRLPGTGGRLSKLRLSVSYRHGNLGGTRRQAAQTTLGASLSDTETGTVDVADGARFPTGGTSSSVVVKIGGEYLEVNPDPGTDSMDILARGVRGTTPSAHDADDRIQYAPPAIRKAVAARAGMLLIQSSRYRGFLPDTDDDLDSGDVLSEMASTWNTTIDAMS